MTMEYGVVTSVRENDGIVYCNVQALRKGTTYDDRPVLKPHSGFVQVPKQGNIVAIEQFHDDTRFITGVVSDNEADPGDMTEGELAIKLDADTQLYFKKRRDGNFNVNISASGDVNVETDEDDEVNVISENGDVNVNTESGDVNVTSAQGKLDLSSNDGILIDGIPFADHVHDYTDDEISDTGDGSGTETAQNKTTDKPKDGTN